MKLQTSLALFSFSRAMFKCTVNINREKFEQNADAVSEAPELLRSNELSNLHSYDSLIDQGNVNIQSDLESDVPFDESLHEQDPEHLAQTQSVQSNQAPCGIVTHLYHIDVLDDLLHASIRSLNR